MTESGIYLAIIVSLIGTLMSGFNIGRLSRKIKNKEEVNKFDFFYWIYLFLLFATTFYMLIDKFLN